MYTHVLYLKNTMWGIRSQQHTSPHNPQIHQCSVSFENREPTLWSLSAKKWDHTIRQYTSSHAATHMGCNLKARTAMLLLGKVVYEHEDSNEGCHHGCHPAAWFRLENLSSKVIVRKTGNWREQLIYRYGNPHHLELVHRPRKKSSRSIHIITLNRKLMYQGFIDNKISVLQEGN